MREYIGYIVISVALVLQSCAQVDGFRQSHEFKVAAKWEGGMLWGGLGILKNPVLQERDVYVAKTVVPQK